MPTATDLAPLVNAYTIGTGPTKTISIPNASALAALQDVTVPGTLIKKQVIALNPRTGRRQVSLGARGGTYGIETDGDLHFCLGPARSSPTSRASSRTRKPGSPRFNRPWAGRS